MAFKYCMKNFLIAVCIFMYAPGVVAQADDYSGLYFLKGTEAPSSCDRIERELHPGGMIIRDRDIFRGETVCKLGQPQVIGAATEFVSNCHSEGEPFREIHKHLQKHLMVSPWVSEAKRATGCNAKTRPPTR